MFLFFEQTSSSTLVRCSSLTQRSCQKIYDEELIGFKKYFKTVLNIKQLDFFKENPKRKPQLLEITHNVFDLFLFVRF